MKMPVIIQIVLAVAVVGFTVAMFNPPPTKLSHWIIGLIPIAILLFGAYKLNKSYRKSE